MSKSSVSGRILPQIYSLCRKYPHGKAPGLGAGLFRGRGARALAGYVNTPHGVFPLRHFFQPGVPAATGGLVATLAVKAYLRALIEGEDGGHPLSDLALAAALRQRGFVLARRTVAKYRSELVIPPCYRRTDRKSVMLGVDIPISLN